MGPTDPDIGPLLIIGAILGVAVFCGVQLLAGWIGWTPILLFGAGILIGQFVFSVLRRL